MSNGINTVSKSSHKESKTASSTKPQSSETLTISSSPVPLKNTRGLSMWLQQGFPANHSQLLERKKDKTMRGTSGRKRSNVFAMFDPDTHSWRTSQVCLILDTLAKSSLRWPKQGSMQDGVCSEQTMWVPHTGVRDSGYWPTPRANSAMASTITPESAWAENRFPNLETVVGQTMWPTPNTLDSLPPKSPEALHKEATVARPGRSQPANLRDAVSNMHNWPTPAARDWHTPQGERVEKNGMGGYILRKKNKPDNTFGAGLADAVEFEEKKMWPTPTVQDSNKATKRWREDHQNNLTAAVFNPERMFPTPTTRDYKGGYTTESLTRKDGKSRAMDALPNAVLDGKGVETSTGGQLNPMWVEWLMGWPLGWTDLKPLETDKYRQWLQQHGCC